MLRLNDLKAEWKALESEMWNIQGEYIDAINNWANEKGIPHVGTGIAVE
jgi:hypothetical protein